MPTPTQHARMLAVVPAAQAGKSRFGVPASITLAQWEIESTWGASQLSVKCNNFFGIKAMHLTAPDTYEEFPTPEYENGHRVIIEAAFEKFASEADCFLVHARLLATADRYARAMSQRATPKLFAVALQNAGYSTSPNYAASLVRLMNEGNLYQYDTLPVPPTAAQKAA